MDTNNLNSLTELEAAVSAGGATPPMPPAARVTPAVPATPPAPMPAAPITGELPPLPEPLKRPAPPMPRRPVPPPRRQPGKGWVSAWRVVSWILCVALVGGATAFAVLSALEIYGDLLALEPILFIAAYFLGALLLGVFQLCGVMVLCGIFRELAAARRAADSPRIK